ncbi:uncharacterized protein LOC101057441 [Pan troglodytes]|uniref:uncharacterized protein LOC101057441 n=1 Tax=Pan troglodytes TaxID=9598 RepID=UPI0007DB9843|nr:uncharacterized protein LOC101057441 [Pan troglodytes]
MHIEASKHLQEMQKELELPQGASKTLRYEDFKVIYPNQPDHFLRVNIPWKMCPAFSSVTMDYILYKAVWEANICHKTNMVPAPVELIFEWRKCQQVSHGVNTSKGEAQVRRSNLDTVEETIAVIQAQDGGASSLRITYGDRFKRHLESAANRAE